MGNTGKSGVTVMGKVNGSRYFGGAWGRTKYSKD